MCSELFRIPVELGGVALFGNGVLLWLWLIGISGWLLWQRKSGMPAADAWGFAPLVLVAAALIFFLPTLFPEGLPIRGYGLMLLLASISGIGLAVHRAQQNGLHPDVIFSLAIWLFVCGIAGARLFYVIEYWETRFAALPARQKLAQMLMFTEGGLVVYGSLIGASVAFVLYCRRHRLPLLSMADILAPSLVVGLALGRIGCLLNGCCYGGPSNAAWAVTFPINSPAYQDQLYEGRVSGVHIAEDRTGKTRRAVLREVTLAEDPEEYPIDKINRQPVESLTQANRLLNRAYWSGEQVTIDLVDGRRVQVDAESKPVHPTQVYSAVNAAILAWLTWALYPFRRRDGEVIGVLLTLYPISRFLLEQIRTDEAAIFGTGLSISQNISIGILAAVGVYWYILLRRPKSLAKLA